MRAQLGDLDASTLRVYLAALRQLAPWRRHGDAVDVGRLSEDAGVSTRRVYSAMRALTDAGALTWTATGPRSGIVGLPRAGSAPAPGRTWDNWGRVSAAATELVDALLVRHALTDGEDAPEGWVVKRGAGGVREASAPVPALRLAVALLAAAWPSQSPVVAATDVDTAAVGRPEPVRLAWRWLTTNTGTAYTPRRGRRPGLAALPGYEAEALPEPTTGQEKAPNPGPPHIVTVAPPAPSLLDPPTSSPSPFSQVDLPRPPLPPTPGTGASTHQTDGQGGRRAREQQPEPPAAAPPGDPVCMPPDEAALVLALGVLGAIGAPAPATRQATRALMRRCAEPAEVLAAAGWASADVTDWLAADLRANPVKQVRDASALAGHLLGKAAAAAAAGAKRPTAVRAAAAERAEAERAEALAHRKRVDDARRATAAVVAEALPHLAEMTAEERFALRPRGDRRRWEVSDFADLDGLHAAVLEPLCWTWHTKRCEDELSAVGWEAAADFAQARELSWFAEQIREDRALPKMFAAPLHSAWCAAHHTHDGGVSR